MPLSLDSFEVPASTGRAGAPLRVGRGPSCTEPRPLPSSLREEERLSRPGTPSAAEHPSRVFLRSCGFAAALRSLALVFPPGDGSPGGETPGHTTEGHPSTMLREVSSALTDFCNTNLTRGQHREPLDPRYRECPCGTPRPRSFVLKKRAERAGRRAMGLLPPLIRTRCPGERTSRAGRNVSLLRDTCAPPVALPWLASESKHPVLPWSAETRLPRVLEKDRASTRIEVHCAVQGLATPVGIAPIRLLQVVPRSIHCREARGRREPTLSATGLSLSPSRVEERIRPGGPTSR